MPKSRRHITNQSQAASARRFSAEALILLSMGLLIAAVASIRLFQ